MRFPFPPTKMDSSSVEPSVAVESGMEVPSAPPQPASESEEVREGGILEDIERIVADLEEREAASLFDEEEAQGPVAAHDTTAEPEPKRVAPRPRARRKIIAFPRQIASPPPVYHRLADPIAPEQPRILDVPEELEAFPATPLLDGLHLPASVEQPAFASPDHIELPFQAADISRRVYAGLIDCSLVTAAAGVFGAVCYKMLPGIGRGKPVLIAAGMVVVLLWAVYQYLFLIYGGGTPGMHSMDIRMRTFKGVSPGWRHRRSRVAGLYLSTASLAMGLLWALVDVDALCWHDRISRTYLTKSSSVNLPVQPHSADGR